MNKYNFKFRITARHISLISLCLFLILASVATVSCSPKVTPTEAEPSDSEVLVEAVRVTRTVKAGELIPSDAVELVSLRIEDAPFNPVKTLDEVAGKYATVDLYVGDFITRAKLGMQDPKDSLVIDKENYIFITQYKSLVKDNDYTDAINKAIEENPNSTIYFPDGTYEISDTVVIPAHNARSVSIKLSNYATIKAVNWSDKAKPMVRMGVYGTGEDVENVGKPDHTARNVYFMGGIIDASGIASGITVEGSEDILLANFTVKNSYIGVELTDPKNSTHSTSADIENVHVVGNGEEGSIGILVGSSLNTLTNMRTSRVQYGMMCTENGSNNIFRSIHAIGTELVGINNAGFCDLSSGNQYDVCHSNQFAVGFLIGESARSTYNSCTCSWISADNNYHVGFRAEGKFNSSISYSKVYHSHNVDTDAYLLVGTDGGSGFVYYPIDQTMSDKYAGVLEKYCPTDILN